MESAILVRHMEYLKWQVSQVAGYIRLKPWTFCIQRISSTIASIDDDIKRRYIIPEGASHRTGQRFFRAAPGGRT